jgi:hypothetical protein
MATMRRGVVVDALARPVPWFSIRPSAEAAPREMNFLRRMGIILKGISG